MQVHKSKLIMELTMSITISEASLSSNKAYILWEAHMVMLGYSNIISLYIGLMRPITVSIVLHHLLCLIDPHHQTHTPAILLIM